MATILYICMWFYSMEWGLLPWVYISDIFPTQAGHDGLAIASASQWFFNSVVPCATPTLEAKLSYTLLFIFPTINIGGILGFTLLIPGTKSRILENMRALFGLVSKEQRNGNMAARERALEQGNSH